MAMKLANTIISVVGDLLVLVALIVAVKALNTANGARADAVTADQTASQERARPSVSLNPGWPRTQSAGTVRCRMIPRLRACGSEWLLLPVA
jgi:hypothetical protein